MSMSRYPFPPFELPLYPDRRGDIWRWLFADTIRDLRLARRLSIQRAAQLAGMEYSEWAVLEDGHPPVDSERLRPIAAVLEVDWEELSRLRRLP
jgi:transcriptional regulator with XRE-family HTH domain